MPKYPYASLFFALAEKKYGKEEAEKIAKFIGDMLSKEDKCGKDS